MGFFDRLFDDPGLCAYFFVVLRQNVTRREDIVSACTKWSLNCINYDCSTRKNDRGVIKCPPLGCSIPNNRTTDLIMFIKRIAKVR